MMHPSAIIAFQLRSAIIDDPLTLSPDTTVMESIARMNEVECRKNLKGATELPAHAALTGCVLVVENDRLVGMLTDRDLVRAIGMAADFNELTIRDVMTQPAISLQQTRFTDLSIAIDLLCQHHIRYLPLVDAEDRPIGLLTRESLQPRSHTNELWLEHVSTLERELAEKQQRQTQLEQHNQHLAMTNEDLMRANYLKDEFLTNMSHELRTPLNAILGMAEGLQEGIFGATTPEQIQAIETIENSSNHLLALIDDILDLAKIGAGQIELDCTPTDICELCYSSLSFVKQQAIKKQIRLQIQLPPRLPNISIDERRIRQVLINLLNNAVKFTPIGGHIVLSVSIESDNSTASWVRFAVTDTGIGINSAEIHKLFQPFVQVDVALNRQYNGTGLGLALVKGFVEMHDGHVCVESELGVGSRFVVDLPIVGAPALDGKMLPPAEFSQPIAQRIERLTDEVASGRVWKVLLAEDNEANINSIASFLKAKGYHTILARNGLEAVNLAQSQLPDLILMDIQMPRMDGLEAIRYLRAQPQTVDIPIIAVTALAMSGDRQKCLSAGANEYLAKPIKLKQLSTTIQQFLIGASKVAAV